MDANAKKSGLNQALPWALAAALVFLIWLVSSGLRP